MGNPLASAASRLCKGVAACELNREPQLQKITPARNVQSGGITIKKVQRRRSRIPGLAVFRRSQLGGESPRSLRQITGAHRPVDDQRPRTLEDYSAAARRLMSCDLEGAP